MNNDEHIHSKETKRLLKNTKMSINKTDENPLLSSKLMSFLKIVNISILVYIIFSTIFYFVVHYYGKRVIQSKTTRIEYENLLYQNLFVNFYFVLTTTIGFTTIKKRSLYYFCMYYLTLILYSVVFIISYFSNLYADFLINKKFIWFSFFILFVVSLIFLYLVYHCISIIQQNKKYLENSETTASNLIHEINLRTDMFKISFNYYVIKSKLNKIVPTLLFKKDSFYYTKLTKQTTISNKKKEDENKNEKVLDVGFTKNNNLTTNSTPLESTFYRSGDTYSSL